MVVLRLGLILGLMVGLRLGVALIPTVHDTKESQNGTYIKRDEK